MRVVGQRSTLSPVCLVLPTVLALAAWGDGVERSPAGDEVFAAWELRHQGLDVAEAALKDALARHKYYATGDVNAAVATLSRLYEDQSRRYPEGRAHAYITHAYLLRQSGDGAGAAAVAEEALQELRSTLSNAQRRELEAMSR